MNMRHRNYKRYSGEVKLSHSPAWRSAGVDKYSPHVDCDSKRNCIVVRASLLRGYDTASSTQAAGSQFFRATSKKCQNAPRAYARSMRRRREASCKAGSCGA